MTQRVVKKSEGVSKEDDDRRVEHLRLALATIRAWASCDYWSLDSRDKAMDDIAKKCNEALEEPQ